MRARTLRLGSRQTAKRYRSILAAALFTLVAAFAVGGAGAGVLPAAVPAPAVVDPVVSAAAAADPTRTLHVLVQARDPQAAGRLVAAVGGGGRPGPGGPPVPVGGRHARP